VEELLLRPLNQTKRRKQEVAKKIFLLSFWAA
jgi:hypothetical protein